MTGLIREIHEFKYCNTSFFCWDLTVQDYLELVLNHDVILQKILLEFNKEIPHLNKRQMNNFINILAWNENILLNNLQKKKQIEDKNKDILKDWHILEWSIMFHLKQPLSEIRSWPIKYFFEIIKDLPIITWNKEYTPGRNSQKPDKKGFKKELNEFYK